MALSLRARHVVIVMSCLVSFLVATLWMGVAPPSDRDSPPDAISNQRGGSPAATIASKHNNNNTCAALPTGGVSSQHQHNKGATTSSASALPAVHPSQRHTLENIIESSRFFATAQKSKADRGQQQEASLSSPSSSSVVESLHLHVITLGDSTAFGVSAKNLRDPQPFGPVLAEALAKRFQVELRHHYKPPAQSSAASSTASPSSGPADDVDPPQRHDGATISSDAAARAEGDTNESHVPRQQPHPQQGSSFSFWSRDVAVTWSSEVHAFPGFSSKKAVFALKKLETSDLEAYLARQREKSLKDGGTGVEENWFSATNDESGGGVGNETAADGAAQPDGPTSDDEGELLQKDLAMEEATEERMGGNKFDGGVGVRLAGSPTTGGGGGGGGGKKGGAQGYNRFMMQSESDDDKDLVELTYESFYRRFAQRTVDARKLHLGLGKFSKEDSSRFISTSRRRRQEGLVGGGTDLLVVVCNVLAGVNDAMMGIPWWWTRVNLHRLHDMCRVKVERYIRQSAGNSSSGNDGAGCASSTTVAPPPRPPKLTIVLSVPLRIIPPFYFLQEGMTAQTFRRAKRVLDPMGQCEFYFRSPRRKLNLYHMMDIMPWVGVSSHGTYRHSRLLESYDAYVSSSSHHHHLRPAAANGKMKGLMLWNPTAQSNRWCRRPVACRGIPIAKDFSNTKEAKLYVSDTTKPCFSIPVAGSHNTTTTICYIARRMIPTDKHFIFPDKLSSTGQWRYALSRWDDCLHPSPLGYHTLGEEIAGKVSRDLINVLRVMASPVPVLNTTLDDNDNATASNQNTTVSMDSGEAGRVTMGDDDPAAAAAAVTAMEGGGSGGDGVA
jgi:hypothetical protein